MSKKCDILFFTRGKGWGHSIRDMEIQKAIRRYDASLISWFASYGDGLKAFQSCQQDAISIANPYDDEITSKEDIIRLCEEANPKVVVTDELVQAENIARIRGMKTFFITNYFDEQEYKEIKSEILFAEFADMVFEDIENKAITFCGPVFQRFQIERKSKEGETPFMLVVLGGSSENLVKLENIWLLKEICRSVPESSKLVIVGDEYKRYFPEWEQVSWISRKNDLSFYYSKCSLCIIRGGLNTLWEMAYMGIPTISVPYSSSVNIMELRYASVMAKRGLTSLCTYEDIKNGQLEKWIKYLLQYGNQQGIEKKVEIFLQDDPSAVMARKIVSEVI